MKSLDVPPAFDPRKPSVTSVLGPGELPDVSGFSADDAALVALGYRPEFKREFSLWTTFCVSFAVLGLLPSFASTLYYGMGYAGTGGMVWGWIISWVFIQCIAMAMAELCSSMPTRYVCILKTKNQSITHPIINRSFNHLPTMLTPGTVEVSTTQPLFSRPQAMDHSQLG